VLVLAAGCVRERRVEVPPIPEQRCASAPACQEGCTARIADACCRLAELELSGSGVTRDLERAAQHYAQACELGDGRGCARAGLLTKDGGTVLLDRSAPLLEEGCVRGQAEACELIASLALERGQPTRPKEAAKAISLYDDACARKDGEACLHEGVLLSEGRLVAADASRAIARLVRACDLGLAGGCAAAGLKHLRGEGVQQNDTLGHELMRRAKVLSQAPDAGP
jgi:TPR repeat protein